MSDFTPWQSGTALLATLGLSTGIIAPLMLPVPVLAQTQSTLPAGTTIPIRYDQGDKILVTPTETTPVTLIVTQEIRAPLGTTLIPAGSMVKGDLQPGGGGGSRYVAKQVTLPNGRTLALDATSQVVTRTEVIKKRAPNKFNSGGNSLGKWGSGSSLCHHWGWKKYYPLAGFSRSWGGYPGWGLFRAEKAGGVNCGQTQRRLDPDPESGSDGKLSLSFALRTQGSQLLKSASMNS
ncbi:hypothetical protein [Neosynechococcus sphagnicola]|uniref:hypothetical protein n=1 Tax=Neosynechococcus sphagnicola TaxID=1501145 RepID=UPI00068C1858|nr:hypothetical protein [Neosynechococcus sphagnicola]